MTLQEFQLLDQQKQLVELWHHGKLIEQSGDTRLCFLHSFLVEVTFNESMLDKTTVKVLSGLPRHIN